MKDIDLQHPLFTRIVLPICRVAAFLIFLVLGPVRTIGRYRVPRAGGLIVLSNHLADIDPVVVQMACPREVYFMAKSEIFEIPVLGRIIRSFRAFPVKRGEPDRDAIRRAASYAQAGKVVCMFPEGQLSEDGELQELKPGVALIVRLARCPVICLTLRNTNKVMPYGSLIPRPSFRATVATWSEPREFDEHENSQSILQWAESQFRSELQGN